MVNLFFYDLQSLHNMPFNVLAEMFGLFAILEQLGIKYPTLKPAGTGHAENYFHKVK
jgi:hypothetical protein